MSLVVADNSEPLVVGSTYRFQLTALQDGAALTLDTETCNVYFRKPSGDVVTGSMSKAGGVAYYDYAPDVAGNWRLSFEVADIDQESAPHRFTVVNSP